MDFAVARQNMVESQLRPNKITDDRIIAAMRTVPREVFVPKTRQHLSYLDEDVALEPGRFLTEPRLIATMIQSLEIRADDAVLVVGAGTGYAAAIIGQIANTVFALESEPQLAALASSQATSLGYDNVIVLEGNLTAGWPDEGPYDAILVDGAVSEIPEALVAQVKVGGRLATVVKTSEPVGQVVVETNTGATMAHRVVCDAAIPYLEGFEPKPAFQF